MICYIIITGEIIFDTNGTFAWHLLQIILNILLFPWLIYAIKFFRVPLEGRDKILRMWTTSSFVEDEKEREDYTNGIDHARITLSKIKKTIRGKYNAIIIEIISVMYLILFLVTYFYGLL